MNVWSGFAWMMIIYGVLMLGMSGFTLLLSRLHKMPDAYLPGVLFCASVLLVMGFAMWYLLRGDDWLLSALVISWIPTMGLGAWFMRARKNIDPDGKVARGDDE